MGQHSIRWSVAVAGALVAMGLAALGGCGAPNRHRIETGDLTARPVGKATIELAPRAGVGGIGVGGIEVGGIGGVPVTPRVARVVDAQTARGGVGSIRVVSGEPDKTLFVVTDDAGSASGSARPAVLGEVMVDSVVGQINGRPVFASEFFEPMDARLIAQAKTLSEREWLEMAQGEIRGRLHDLVRDELLLAEFESGLTVQQRSGLIFFVTQIRDNLVSQHRGSEERLTEKLLEEEGVTIDEKVESQRRQAFIREHLRNELGDMAYVPWRDVLLQYKQDADLYNPAPTAHLRMIRVPSDDAEAIERVRLALEAGEAFEAVAERESTFRAALGGTYNIELTGETYSQSRLFGPEELNAAATGLAAGEFAGPVIMDNGGVAWIKLDSVEADTTSLYDAQFAIHEALRNKRLLEEESKYFQKLINQSSLSPIQEMERRLLEISSTRYLIRETP